MADIRLKISGDRKGSREVLLRCPGRYILGRDDKCDVVIADHLASKRHCQIEILPSGARLRDLRSTNGTRVNGDWIGSRAADQNIDNITPFNPGFSDPSGTMVRRPDDEVPLGNGAEVEVGSTEIRVIYDILPGDTDMIEKQIDDAKQKLSEATRIIQLVIEADPTNDRAIQLRRIIQAMEFHL